MITRISVGNIELRVVNRFISSYSMRSEAINGPAGVVTVNTLFITMQDPEDVRSITNPKYAGRDMTIDDMDNIMLNDHTMAHIYQ